MVKKSGLGRGLSSLIGEIPAIKNKPSKGGVLLNIPIDQIKPNPRQPRMHFAHDKMEELAASIKEQGVLQPILVRPNPHKKGAYELVAGERRLRATQLAGITTIPAQVREVSDENLRVLALIENIQRDDLDPIEEAIAYRELQEEHGAKQEAIAVQVSKSRSAIANSLRLLELPDEVQQMLINGVLSAGHARCILGLRKTSDRLKLAIKINDDGLSVRQVENLINGPRTAKSKKKKRPAKASDDPFYVEIRGLLEEKLGTKVQVSAKGNNGKGKIEIDFYNEDDLGRLLHLLHVDFTKFM